MTGAPRRIVPFGDAAVLVELGGTTGIAAARRARAVAAAIDTIRADAPALRAPVAAATSVLVPFDPRATTTAEVAARVEAALAQASDTTEAAAAAPASAIHELAVRYGGGDGPDLVSVSEELALRPRDVVELHAAATYEVLFAGFAPGFAYLGELPARLVAPRLATPRPRVPAGSVAIAGSMTAVYPQASAGGWRLLGRTDATLFDPSATPPARLRPGDRVRFVPA